MEEEFGTLQIRVYTSRAQLPIEDATVVVTQISPTGKYHLLSVQISDREGRVQPLTIPAPPRWESTGPTQDMVPFFRLPGLGGTPRLYRPAGGRRPDLLRRRDRPGHGAHPLGRGAAQSC